jgi:hypothetical protein
VQEDREVLADRAETQIDHGLRGAANDHPVAVATRAPQQAVSDGATNKEGFHGLSVEK